MEEFQATIEAFKLQKEVDAIVLGGSRASGKNDEESDYDVYVYLNRPLAAEKRQEILEATCSYIELGNHYWELEDDCRMKSGTGLELIYRDIAWIDSDLKKVLIDHQAATGYTTCVCYNVLNAKILYDPMGKYAALVEKYNFPYPEPLREAIIQKNRELLDGKIPSYSAQIEKALQRGDIVSVNHRITEFLASYFDIIFALNRKYHPGEKRLIEICLAECELLPENFQENIECLLMDKDKKATVKMMVSELDNCL